MSIGKQYLIFIFFSFFGIGLVSAQDSIVQRKPERSIELVAEGYVTSNAITNNFIKSFYFGDFIGDQLKNDVSKKLTSTI